MDKTNPSLKRINTPQTTPTPLGGGVLRIASKDLFAGAQEVEISHHGVLYRLRQTSLGKLILTK